jgi:ribosomal protein S27AE
MQGGPFVVVEVVAPAAPHLIETHKLDHFPLGQVGGLIEDEAPVVDVSFERLHLREVYVSVVPLTTACSSPLHRGSRANLTSRVQRRDLRRSSARTASSALDSTVTALRVRLVYHRRMFCPRCGEGMDLVNGTFTCVRGDMELSRRMHDALSEVFVARTRSARSRPLNWGEGWFCPGCGVAATTDPEHVRCGTCGEYLDEFLPQLIELHPHRARGGKWTERRSDGPARQGRRSK